MLWKLNKEEQLPSHKQILFGRVSQLTLAWWNLANKLDHLSMISLALSCRDHQLIELGFADQKMISSSWLFLGNTQKFPRFWSSHSHNSIVDSCRDLRSHRSTWESCIDSSYNSCQYLRLRHCDIHRCTVKSKMCWVQSKVQF